MDSSEESDKKMNKAKSFSASHAKTQIKMKNEPAKGKSFNVNEATKSLDLASVRLKKSKLVNGECVVTASSSPPSPSRRGYAEMFMDVASNAAFCSGMSIDKASMLSMNFSHYELARNLSNSVCNSEEAVSSTTSNARANSPETIIKNEHLEKYFRSAEMWSQRHKDGGLSKLHLSLPEK